METSNELVALLSKLVEQNTAILEALTSIEMALSSIDSNLNIVSTDVSDMSSTLTNVETGISSLEGTCDSKLSEVAFRLEELNWAEDLSLGSQLLDRLDKLHTSLEVIEANTL